MCSQLYFTIWACCMQILSRQPVLPFVFKTSSSALWAKRILFRECTLWITVSKGDDNTNLSQAICKTGLLTEIQETAGKQPNTRNSQVPGWKRSNHMEWAPDETDDWGNKIPRGSHVLKNWPSTMIWAWEAGKSRVGAPLHLLQKLPVCVQFTMGTGNGVFLWLDSELCYFH